LAKLKKAVLWVAGAAVQKLMASLSEEQEILMNIADMIGYIYLTESTLLRVEKLVQMRGEDATQRQIDVARVYLHRAVDVIYVAGKNALYSFADGGELATLMSALRYFTEAEPFNSKAARQRIARQLITANAYCY